MIPDLVTPLNAMFASRANPRMARSVNASAIGHPCERCLVFDQCRVAKADPDLQTIYALGKMMETQAMIDLQEALKGTDMQVVSQQAPIPPNPYGIGGVIDLFIESRTPEGKRIRIPGEFKSCSPFTFPQLNTVMDMREHRTPWVRKWPAQLTVYMVMTNSPEGFFLLRNKLTGHYKQIPVPLDYEYAESLLAKAERVSKAVKAYQAAQSDEERVAALPPRIPFDPVVCEKCPHYSVCIPDPNSLPEADNRLWDVHLDALCREVKRLEPMVKEHAEAMEKIKAHCQTVAASAAIGQPITSITEGYFITAKPYETTSYKVPDDIKLPYKTKGRAVRVQIKRIGENDPEA